MALKGYSPSVTVLVLTYNPKIDSLLYTLSSVVSQRNIDFEIIISDDGSKDNCFDEIDLFMKNNSFTDYKKIAHDTNRGTVYNVYDGLLNSSGEYVKLISPGDALLSSKTLASWTEALKNSGRKWSYADAVYYNNAGNKPEYIKHFANPQHIKFYLKGNDKECRRYYTYFNDIVLGAVTLCSRELIIEYIKKILGRIVYTEDCIYKLITYDGYVAFYYPCDTVYYEFGTGISTSDNSEWNKKIKADWDTATSIMLENGCDDKILNDLYSSDGFFSHKLRTIIYLFFRKIYNKIHYMYFQRMTNIDVKDD